MKNHQRDNPLGIPNGIPNHDPEKRLGARTSDLLLRVDFGHELAFCDGTIPASDPAHVLASFKTKDLALAPNLFANIVRAAVALGAQFVYIVHHAPHRGRLGVQSPRRPSVWEYIHLKPKAPDPP